MGKGAFPAIIPERLVRELRGSLFSAGISYRQTVGSTNDLVKDLAETGAPEGTLVLAEEQTGGRGRRGRVWHSPPRANLLFSVLLRPAVQVDGVFALTMGLALSAVEALEALAGVGARIKWPNDIYAGEKKLGGLLTEFSARGKDVAWVVLGLGLNVSWYPEELRNQATSVLAEAHRRVSRQTLLVGILRLFEGHYRQVLAEGPETFQKRWKGACFILGQDVAVVSDKERFTGKALCIDPDGTLVLETGKGLIRKVVAGEVSLRLAAGKTAAPDNDILTKP